MPQHQQSLFDTQPPAWEADAAEQKRQATVVFPKGAGGEFDYLAEGAVEAGRRVRVPFGRGGRLVIGYCVAVGVKPVAGRKLKSIAEVIDSERLLSPAMLRLTRWMSQRYLCPWGQVLEGVLPSGVRGRAGTREVVLLTAPAKVAARLASLDLTEKQRQVLQTLVASQKPLTIKQLSVQAGCATGPITTLRKKGYIESHSERLETGALDEVAVERETPKQLEGDQRAALDAVTEALDAAEHRTILLHGVTGSGKTEVYIQAIEKVVSFGRQAIVLVPEISLTPQTVGRFRARFDRVAVLHSHQSDVERHRHWRRIARGEVQVVVGARSAVFAPTPHLGLIVIDEEHENSFKQDSAPRYHARDVAVERARDEGAPLVLGSATPSLEAWRWAQQGACLHLSLPKRVGGLPLPDVRVIDLGEESHKTRGRGAISRPLRMAMEAALADGGQVILLLNRRGFSTHVQCPACSFLLRCPACEIAMTFHRQDQTALCHWCDHREPPPTVCPDCKSAAIRYGGVGTQKLEDEVRARFPNYRCLRMDADSMRRPGSHEQALDAFRRGEAPILLGTQMIAKGLHFPNVTLVGVVNADTALHMPDFRASERTFQLVTQVAGRTGRGASGGRVLVQTLDREHPAIVAAQRHDYEQFAAEELPVREALGYPPFGSMVRVVVRGAQLETVGAVADEFAQRLRSKQLPSLRVLGPAPAPLAKLRGEHRAHLQLLSPEGEPLREAVSAVLADLPAPEGVYVVVDVDPVDML